MNIALYPGAFKPPTKGHLGVVQQVLSGKYNTAKIDRETGEYEKVTENPKMDQVWIIVGDMVKGGAKQKGSEPEVAVGQDEAMAVWTEYLKAAGIESKVKLYRAGQVREDILNEDVGYVCEGANPVRDTYGILKDKYVRGEHEGVDFFPIVGFRPDNAEALTDLKRMDAASKKYGEQGLQILVVLDEPTPGEESVSATKLRAALAAKDKSKIEKYAAASADALLKHFTKQDKLDQAIAEAMTKAIDDIFSGKMPVVTEDSIAQEQPEKIEESRVDMPSPEIEDIGVQTSEFTSKIEYYKQYFQNLTSYPVDVDKYGNIVIQVGQRLPMNEVVNLNEITSQELDFTPFLSSILEFMLDKGMRITPIPNIEIKMDVDAATDVFGPTAHYDPTNATVCLYVLGRHPKDVLRSFCHEMIHHMQNMEGRLPAFGTTNTQEDSVLNEIEKEAHALGSMTFREWEDTVKNNFDVVKEETLLEQEDSLTADVINPDGEQFDYEGSKGLYTYKDSKGNLYFARLAYNPTSQPFFEFKVGWFEDNDQSKPKYEPALPGNVTSRDNLKRRNTVAAIFVKEVLPLFMELDLSSTLKIDPISKKRYSFSERMVDKLVPSDLHVEKDGDVIIITKQQDSSLNEIGDASQKPYNWSRTVSKDPDDGLIEKVAYKFTTDLDTPYVAFFGMLAPMEYDFRYSVYGERNYYTSNKGELFRVMATIVDIVKDFMDLMGNDWSEISFTGSKDPSRSEDNRRDKLYMAYIKKHLPPTINVGVNDEGFTAITNTLAESLNERRGKMNPFAKKLTSIAFELIKDAHENGSKVLDKLIYVGPDEEMDIKSDIEFDFRIFMERGPYNYTGGADNADLPDEDGDYPDPYLMVSATLPDGFTNWSELYMDLLDVVRHELEHLRQGGPNVRKDGWMKDDSHIRAAINVGLVPEKEYYKLEKEVDAMIQGLWLHAKKAKKPLIDVINRYLDAQGVEGEDRKEVLDAWSKRLPALGVSKDQRF